MVVFFFVIWWDFLLIYSDVPIRWCHSQRLMIFLDIGDLVTCTVSFGYVSILHVLQLQYWIFLQLPCTDFCISVVHLSMSGVAFSQSMSKYTGNFWDDGGMMYWFLNCFVLLPSFVVCRESEFSSPGLKLQIRYSSCFCMSKIQEYQSTQAFLEFE